MVKGLFTNARMDGSAIRVPLKKVRLAITGRCNFRCVYCRPGGEGLGRHRENMSEDRALFIAKAFQRLGCEKVNLTGGEPLLHRGVADIVHRLLAETPAGVVINTNASLGMGSIARFERTRRISFAISLDSLESSKLMAMGRRIDADQVRSFIEFCKSHGFECRINCVIAAGINDKLDEVASIISFAQSLGCILKLQSVFETSKDAFGDSRKLYRNLRYIRNHLLTLNYSRIGSVNATNGVQEDVYKPVSGSSIRILDKAVTRTRYGLPCRGCTRFPCDSGIYAYYVNEDQQLMLCRNRRETVFDFSRYTSVDEATEALQDALLNSGMDFLWRPRTKESGADSLVTRVGKRSVEIA